MGTSGTIEKQACLHSSVIQFLSQPPAGWPGSVGAQVAGCRNGLFSLAVWHGGPGNVREPDRTEPAGCSEVHTDA